MTSVLHIALGHVLTAIRERITFFWFLIFPIFLLVLLALIFGNVGQEGEISFAVGWLNQDGGGAASEFAAIVESAFQALAVATEDGAEPLFALHRPSEGEDVAAFLERELTAVRRGHRSAVIVIPEGFSATALRSLAPGGTEVARLTVYRSESSVASQMAAEIIEQVLAQIDREILVRGGRYDATQEIAVETTWLGGSGDETRYIDFVLPGIILMGFFMNGLFGVPGTILSSRDRKVLRRYWVTPLSVPRFFVGFSIGHLSLCGLQFALLYLLGRYALGATVSFASAASCSLLALAAVTFLAFGFLIASLAKTANAGMAAANILNLPMMFLSGLFFPISGLPAVLRAIVYVNPVSHLAAGLRASLGVESASLPPLLLVGGPLAWIALSVLVSSLKLKWDVER